MQKITLYVGLNDKDSKVQKINTLEAYKVATNILVKLCGGGTIYQATGIYTHESGEIVTENTLRIEIIGAAPDAISETVRMLKAAFNQESIIKQTEEINSVFC